MIQIIIQEIIIEKWWFILWWFKLWWLESFWFKLWWFELWWFGLWWFWLKPPSDQVKPPGPFRPPVCLASLNHPVHEDDYGDGDGDWSQYCRFCSWWRFHQVEEDDKEACTDVDDDYDDGDMRMMIMVMMVRMMIMPSGGGGRQRGLYRRGWIWKDDHHRTTRGSVSGFCLIIIKDIPIIITE